MHGSLARVAVAALGMLALTGCVGPAMPPLVSAQFPPSPDSSHGQPQPLNSLPPGAANTGSAPSATHPSYLAWTFRAI